MSKHYNWKKDIKNIELEEISKIIKEDGVIVFPTETVYGIGGNALSENAVKKIYNIKKRPNEKALSILVKSKEDIEKYAYISNDIERKIINKFMPGPLTIILKRKDCGIAKSLTAKNGTIGIRIPDNFIIKAILEKCKLPIAAPSANISQKPSAIKLQDILEEFEGKVDAFIDGGTCKEKVSSTIVQVIDEKLVILRKGAIQEQEIIDILN